MFDAGQLRTSKEGAVRETAPFFLWAIDHAATYSDVDRTGLPSRPCAHAKVDSHR